VEHFGREFSVLSVGDFGVLAKEKDDRMASVDCPGLAWSGLARQGGQVRRRIGPAGRIAAPPLCQTLAHLASYVAKSSEAANNPDQNQAEIREEPSCARCSPVRIQRPMNTKPGRSG
jgi:hypothetical protein